MFDQCFFQRQGWQTNEKKKKKSVNNAPTNAAGTGAELEDWSTGGDKGLSSVQAGVAGSAPHSNVRDHRPSSRGRSSGRPCKFNCYISLKFKKFAQKRVLFYEYIEPLLTLPD